MISASLQKLKQAVARPGHSYRQSMQTFSDLDLRRLSSEMRLTEKGSEQGEAELPTDGLTLDATETDIIEAVGAAQKDAHDELENHLAGFRQRLVDLDFKSQFSTISSVAIGGLSELKQELQLAIDELHPVRKDLLESDVHRTEFRKRHRLTRPCKITKPGHNAFKWAILAVLVVLELIVNGQMLSGGNEMGLVGGILEALVFAALNVGVAAGIGYSVLPMLNHRNIVAKVAGIAGLAALVVWSLLLNLALAHFREVSVAVLEGGGEIVLERLFSAPLELQELQSWLLAALGVLFSIVAAVDGLTWKDPYPGYSTVDRAFRTARQRYIDQRADNIERLGETREDHQEALTDIRTDLGRHLADHDGIVEHRQRMIQLFSEHQTQLEKSANALLRTYRDANIKARSTPPPKHFSEPYEMPRIVVSISKEGEWNSGELKDEIRKAQEQVDQIFVALRDQFDAALERYRELDILAPDAQ